jgi:hypothetical protein
MSFILANGEFDPDFLSREATVKIEGGSEHVVTDDIIKIEEITVSEHSTSSDRCPTLVQADRLLSPRIHTECYRTLVRNRSNSILSA